MTPARRSRATAHAPLPTDLANMPPTLTVAEAAKALRIGINETYAAIHSGQIPAIRLGRSVRIPRDALIQRLSAASAIGATPLP